MVVDLTGIAVAVVGGMFSILGIIVSYQLSSRMKDKAAAETLATAIANALGAIQQASVGLLKDHPPVVHFDGVPDHLSVGVQYVLDHAGGEASRLGVTPASIADKINARIGLKSLAVAHAMAIRTGTVPAAAVPVRAAI